MALLLGALCVLLPLHPQAQYFPELLWHRFYGGAGNDVPHRMRLGDSGKLLLAGTWDNETTGGCKQGYLLLVDVNNKGEIVWEQKLSDAQGCSEIRDILWIDKGEAIAFAGTTNTGLTHPETQTGIYAQDFWLGKLDAQGKPMWSKTFGGSKPDQCFALAPTSIGGFLMAGSTWSQDHELSLACASLNNLWALTLTKFAQQQRSLCLGGSKNDWAVDVLHTLDGGHLLLGYTTSEDLDGSKSRTNGDAWVIKLNETGEVQWQRVLKEPYEDVLNRVTQTKYGVYAAVGSSFHPQKAKQNWFVKLDENGRITTDKKWGGAGFEELTGIAPTRDGGFITTGWSYYYTLDNRYIKGQRDLWVIRLDAEGDIIWQQTYGGPDNEEGVDVVEYAPNHYLVLGKKRNTFVPVGTDSGDDFWLLSIKEHPCSDMVVTFETNNRKNKAAIDEPIRFVNKSQNIERWQWDFGDGTKSTEHSPLHKFKQPGDYVVKLTGYQNEGCQKTYLFPAVISIR